MGDIILCNDAWQHNNMVNAVKLARNLGTSGARLLVADSKGKNHQQQVNSGTNLKKRNVPRHEAFHPKFTESDYNSVFGTGRTKTGGYTSYDITAWPFSFEPLCAVVPKAEKNIYDKAEQESIVLFQLPQAPVEGFTSATESAKADRCFCEEAHTYTFERGSSVLKEEGVGAAGAV